MPTYHEKLAQHVADNRAVRGDGRLNLPTDYNPRHCEWGHWSITFWTRDVDHMRGPWDTYLPGFFVAEVPFAIGNQGPIDGTLGSPLREHYRKLCRDWVHYGIKPVDFRNRPVRP